MKKVAQETLDAIRQRCDIADVIRTYIPLQRVGSALKALCPFHKEKTPSFHVNPARQIFHCFGCGAGGDVFRFIMDHEKVDFMTSVRMLAQRAGVEIEVDETERSETLTKDRLLRVHEAVTQYFQSLLADDRGAEEARAYLRQRKMDGDGARRFRIGWGGDRSGVLLDWGAANGFESELMEAAGLIARGESGLYDRFRRRVLFPICDEQSRVIGFSGRILHEEESPAKYVNSPETPLFRKSRVLYAIDKARRAILDKRSAILCEGQIDTLRCHLAGIENAVAAQGTAVTEDHARILARYADETIVMLDADDAGRTAAIRSSQILMGAGLSVRLVTLPPGEDPDSMILAHGVQSVLDLLDAAESAPFFVLRAAEAAGEMATDAGRTRTLRSVLEIIASANMASTREDLLRKTAARLGLSVDALRSDLRVQPPRRAIGTDDGEADGPSTAQPERRPEELALVGLAVLHPNQRVLIRDYCPIRFITDPLLRRILEAALAREPGDDRSLTADAGDDAEFARVAAEMEMDTRRFADAESSPDRAARDCIVRVWRKEFTCRRTDIASLAARASGPERDNLMIQANNLTLQIRNLGMGWDKALAVIEFHE